MVDTL